jgi:rod shape-determining protein MreD
VGMGVAFLMGIVMDVADASVMGQHALAYVLIAYLASSLSRRILWFPLLEQALHVLPILLFAQLVQFAARMIAGGDFPGFGYFVGPLIATVLWVPGTYMLMLPQFRPVNRDENRPI